MIPAVPRPNTLNHRRSDRAFLRFGVGVVRHEQQGSSEKPEAQGFPDPHDLVPSVCLDPRTDANRETSTDGGATAKPTAKHPQADATNCQETVEE